MKNDGPSSKAETIRRLVDVLFSYKKLIEASIRACDGGYTFDDIVTMAVSGNLVVYEFKKSLILMQPIDVGRDKTYHCLIACGDLQEIAAQQDFIIQDAENLGCNKLSLCGRKGWEKVFAKQGWKLQYVTLNLDIAAYKQQQGSN